MWQVRTTIEPSADPLSLAEARRQCRIEADDTSFDDDLKGYIAASRSWVEGFCDIRLIDQQLELRTARWSDLSNLPMGPIREIEQIAFRVGGVDTELTNYTATLNDSYGSIAPEGAAAWPAIDRGSEIALLVAAGFGGPSDVPADIKQVMKMLVAAMDMNRGSFPPEVLETARMLLRNAGRCRVTV